MPRLHPPATLPASPIATLRVTLGHYAKGIQLLVGFHPLRLSSLRSDSLVYSTFLANNKSIYIIQEK